MEQEEEIAMPANKQPNNRDQQNTFNETEIQKPQTQQDIPPIVLRDPAAWLDLSKTFNEKRINFLTAESTQDGVRIRPTTVDDFRKIVHIMDEQQLPYHTYQLPEEKQLHIVLRGIPTCIPTEDIKANLQNKGFHVEGIHRMRNQKTTVPVPLVLVLLPRKDKDIFNVSELLNLIITVETQHAKTNISQCHNCQRFGHAQSRCNAPPKCVKCGKEHHTRDFLLTKDERTTCANCRGNPASYKGCPKYPKPNNRNKFNAAIRDNRSYAQAAGSTPTTMQADILIQMQQMFNQIKLMMETFINRAKNNATTTHRQ